MSPQNDQPGTKPAAPAKSQGELPLPAPAPAASESGDAAEDTGTGVGYPGPGNEFLSRRPKADQVKGGPCLMSEQELKHE